MSRGIRRIARYGQDLIRDPLLNKGSAFTPEERRSLGLEGILPQRSLTMEMQRRRVNENLDRLVDPLEKYVALAALQDRNEHLFFDVLMNRIEDFLPIVYTPTVGLATQRFSHVFQRGRGVWVTPDLRGRVAPVLRQAAGGRRVRLIVATDNESILGIGDQGAGGIAISIGKLALYTAAAGIDPAEVLPVSIDVGTNNDSLLEDPFYLGWPQRRLRGSAYEQLLDEFVAAVASVFPGALVQWEDFRKDNALRVLDRYQAVIPSFNDDIQGTGAVALAGLLTAQRVTGRRLRDERVVILGGGAAGLGIARQIRAGMAADGMPPAAVSGAIAVLDSKGLITNEAQQTDAYKAELAWPSSLASERGLQAGRRDLAAVVASFRPTVLIGTSGQPGAFNEPLIRAMAGYVRQPVILPLSNPTSSCEACPEDLYRWTEGTALVATGSPFADVVLEGARRRVAQGNNAYVFPGVGLAMLAGQLDRAESAMFLDAAWALASCVSDDELISGLLYPPISRLRDVAVAVATAVIAGAIGRAGTGPEERVEIEARVRQAMWEPAYPTYTAS